MLTPSSPSTPRSSSAALTPRSKMPRQRPRAGLQSTDEPNAFRIAPRVAAQFDAPLSSAAPDLSTLSPPPPGPLSPEPSVTSRHFTRTSDPANTAHSDPASWLPSTDLSSPTFNAHHFLQRVLSHRYDKSSRPTRFPQLDDAFDADAALAALDTVESALRRRRDAARRDELSARDALRTALQHSAKRRDNLIRTAHAVTSHVATFGDVGRHASSALQTDLAALKSASARLASLHDSRDLLALLTRDSSELDAVRVSKLLSSANALLSSDNHLLRIMTPAQLDRASDEISRCESELASSVFDWMRRAADDGNATVIAECAQAAEQLGVSESFVEAYVSHVFSLGATDPPLVRGVEDGAPPIVLEPFRSACWDALRVVRDSLASVFESFADPARPLAGLLHMLLQRRVLAVADATLAALVSSLHETETKLKGFKSAQSDSSTSLDAVAAAAVGAVPTLRRRSSVERLRTIAIADTKESWRESAQRAADERRRYLVVSAELFTSLAKLRTELFDLCRVPGAEHVEKEFAALQDPLREFVQHNLGQYLDIQKKWMDDQLGVAFFEITRIDLHAPRLAPRERSNADAYHRYRAFYAQVSSNFHQMTKKAIVCTHESICRSVAVLRSIREDASSSEDGITVGDECPIQEISRSSTNQADALGSKTPTLDFENEDTRGSGELETGDGSDGRASWTARGPPSRNDKQQIIRELLDSLLMNYLANAETLLQAATHLLPLCENDAKMQQLWVSDASPLTSYVRAIELLSKSNEVLSHFIRTLEVPHDVASVSDAALTVESDLDSFIPKQTRESLQGELTSGLSDLSAEAQVGVKAAVSSLRARLFAILGGPQATEVYNVITPESVKSTGRQDEIAAISTSGLDFEPSDAFLTASTLVEQQLHSVMESVKGVNRDFVVNELRTTTREAVLHCWCSIRNTVTSGGALQIIADGKSILRVFQDHRASGEAVECLPAVGQLFLEGADGLWNCVESNALANVDAGVIVSLLRKRDDFQSERVGKVCQSLGANLNSLGRTHVNGPGVRSWLGEAARNLWSQSV